MNDWTVLLIGGSSATGKSKLARQLAEYYKIPQTEADDIRIALQSVLDKTTNPDLFTFLTTPDYLKKFGIDHLVQKLFDVGKEVWTPLNKLIDKHIDCNEPVIFEGDSIIPELLAQRDQNKIRALFLWDDKENLKKRGLERNRGEGLADKADREAEFSYSYGEKLKAQAKKNGFITIKTSPIETLFERVLKEMDQII